MKIVEVATKNDTWYHGTSVINAMNILKVGMLKPHLADYSEPGPGVFFTCDLEQATEFGEVVFAISDKNLRKLKIFNRLTVKELSNNLYQLSY